MDTITTQEGQADAVANVLAGAPPAPWAPEQERGRLAPEAAVRFLFGGNAVLTVVSKRTGERFTYKIQAPKERRGSEVHFVKVLTGPDNAADYQFFGTIFNRQEFRPSVKSRLSPTAPSVEVFEWLIAELLGPEVGSLEGSTELYHEGRCGRCGRLLTVPESVMTGFGPECAGILGVR